MNKTQVEDRCDKVGEFHLMPLNQRTGERGNFYNEINLWNSRLPRGPVLPDLDESISHRVLIKASTKAPEMKDRFRYSFSTSGSSRGRAVLRVAEGPGPADYFLPFISVACRCRFIVGQYSPSHS